MKKALLVLLRGIASVLILTVISVLFKGTPYYIPLNITTVSISATLGAPGIASLIGVFALIGG